MDTAYGPWEPLSLDAAVDTFRKMPTRWWITGGHALELYAGRSWRGHGDIDVALLRRDCPTVLPLLESATGWTAWLAASGVLSRYAGQQLDVRRHENNVWMRRGEHGPWVVDVTVSHGTDEAWVYRRDDAFVLPWDVAVLTSEEGIPYLPPGLQLLYKSARPRAKDHQDAREVIPILDPAAAEPLRTRLPVDHPWRNLF